MNLRGARSLNFEERDGGRSCCSRCGTVWKEENMYTCGQCGRSVCSRCTPVYETEDTIRSWYEDKSKDNALQVYTSVSSYRRETVQHEQFIRREIRHYQEAVSNRRCACGGKLI